jgi:hypothetical protein
MTTAARISLALAVCFFLAYGVIFASGVVTHKRTVQEIDFWMAAGCDEVCLHHKAEGTPFVDEQRPPAQTRGRLQRSLRRAVPKLANQRSSRMHRPICITRAIKNIDYIQRAAPDVFTKRVLKEIWRLPIETLLHLHTIHPNRVPHPKLAYFLRHNKIPTPKTQVSDPLFNGTLVFVRVTFTRTHLPSLFSMSNADIQMAITYATLAAVPIRAYASQYGLSAINVSPSIVPVTADLGTNNTFDDDNLKPWVDTWANTITLTMNIVNPCIALLVDPNGPTNTTQPSDDGYHHRTKSDRPFVFCRIHGTGLTVDDKNDLFAGIVSHEIAEMVIDPKLDGANPEVCDACFGNCSNRQLNFFDNSMRFLGGSAHVTPSPFPGYHFFTDGIIKPEFLDPNSADNCALPGSDLKAVCSYAPPAIWSNPGLLTTISSLVSVSGHYSTADQRDIAIVATSSKIHEVFWKSGQQGIEGEDDLPVSFGNDSIVAVSGFFNSTEGRHIVVAGTKFGKLHEVFWKPDTVGIEGQDDLPVSFDQKTIVGVSGLYDKDTQRHIVIVATTAGKIHEIFWKADTVGIEGHDDLPVTFPRSTIAGVAGFYNSDAQRYIVIVCTAEGKIHEIFWKADTVGIEGHDDLPVTFESSIKGVAGFYNSSDQRHVVIVGTADGKVYQIYWKADTVGIEIRSVIAQFSANSIVTVGGFYSENDQVEHAIIGTTDGKVHELFTRSGQIVW